MNSRLHRLTKPFHRGWGLWRALGAPAAFRERARVHGYAGYTALLLGRERMEHAAWRLPAADAPTASTPTDGTPTDAAPLDVHFLTGRRYWHLTAFCARSLLHHARGAPVRPVVHDDGTLGPRQAAALRRILPNAVLVDAAEHRDRLEAVLPVARFPVLRERAVSFPLFRKLHIHAAEPGWKLFLDSDMLFYRPPGRLLAWLRDPTRPCHMTDTPGDWYGYDAPSLTRLAGRPLPPSVNTGIAGLDGDAIDWEEVEAWARTLIADGGLRFHLEQALVAMYLAGRDVEALPRDDYLVSPDRGETLHPRAVMHHFTGGSRAWYFRFAWRRVRGALRGPFVTCLSLAASLGASAGDAGMVLLACA